jgi:divalent metal cation (Fe/Co/Zn/Cd) transporter
VLVAFRLGRDSRELLIGRAADEEQQAAIRTEIETTAGVDALMELLTMHMGPDHLIIGARVDLSDDISADETEALAARIDRRLAEKLPVTPHVFVDPTSRNEGALTPGDRGS